MRKFCISFVLIGIIVLTIVAVKVPKTHTEYLRIHIRANSNSQVDQSVKYQIKEKVVGFLTPMIAECVSKKNAEKMLEENVKNIEQIADMVLKNNGFDYLSKAKISNEEFPTRVYEEYTLESGFYDALIIELGEAKGDNWWCVVYPPLCFLSDSTAIRYRSKIKDIIQKFYK